MELIKCYHCQIEKPCSEFHKWNSSKSTRKYQTFCKECKKNTNYKRDPETRRTWENKFKSKYLKTCSGASAKLLRASRKNAARKNVEFNLTKEWIENKLKHMTCEVSKLPLTLNTKTEREFRCNPFNPSIDRIDPKKGYTKDNCQLVCWIYNLAKSDFNHEIVMELARALSNNSEILEVS